MKKPSPHVPIAVWVDDSAAEMYADEHLIARIKEEAAGKFDIAVFGESDEAVKFVLNNRDRIFMFVQDSSRPEGTIIPAWRKLKSVVSPNIGQGSHQGDFYTYVIDAYTPEAGAVFAGFGFSQEETKFISKWGDVDGRIVLADKMALSAAWKKERSDFASYWGNQDIHS